MRDYTKQLKNYICPFTSGERGETALQQTVFHCEVNKRKDNITQNPLSDIPLFGQYLSLG